jgi:hypothetical protein
MTLFPEPAAKIQVCEMARAKQMARETHVFRRPIREIH